MHPRHGLARRFALITACIAVPLALAACSSGGSSTSTPATPAAPASGGAGGGNGSTVSIGETEYKLSPATVNAKSGQVTFQVSNDGSVTHSLAVQGPSGTQALNSDLTPGQSGTLTVDLSKPGTYQMYCPIDGHKELGMVGQIVVKG